MESFGKPGKAEPETASIADFNPVDHLAFRADKPVYTSIDYEIRYAPDGRSETSSPVRQVALRQTQLLFQHYLPGLPAHEVRLPAGT